MSSRGKTLNFRTDTFTALQHPNLRIYFAGQLVSISGLWMQRVAQGWLVYHLTGSATWLGIVAFMAGIPTLLFAPYAGVLADRIPRRSILIVTYTLEMTLAFLLAALTFTDTVTVGLVAAVALGVGISNSFSEPSRIAFMFDMVGQNALNSGISLNSVILNSASIIGPSLAGIFLNSFGAAWCFLFNGVSFLAVLISLRFIRIIHPRKIPPHGSYLAQLKAGLRFVRHDPALASLFILAFTNGIVGINMIYILLPAFASVALKSPIFAFTVMSIAIGAGSLVGAVMNVWLGAHIGRGKLVIGWVLVLPFCVLAFSLIHWLPLTAFLCAVMGFGYTVSFVTSNILIQLQVPHEMRGRVTSLWTINRFGIGPVSALLIGAIAQWLGVTTMLAIGAILGTLICGWIVWRSPAVHQLS